MFGDGVGKPVILPKRGQVGGGMSGQGLKWYTVCRDSVFMETEKANEPLLTFQVLFHAPSQEEMP